MLGRLAAGPFRPHPRDLGPVTAEEESALLEFTQQHMPRIGHWLNELKDRRPAAFRERLNDSAPRLRVMMRLHARNPELFTRFTRHVENNERLRRMVRAWRDQDNPRRRERIEDDMHRRVAENLDLELEILDERMHELEADREGTINAEVDRLLSPQLDAAGEPPRIARHIARYHAAQDDTIREDARQALRRMAEFRLDDEIETMREQATHMRANKSERIEQELRRLLRRGGPPSQRGRPDQRPFDDLDGGDPEPLDKAPPPLDKP